MRERQGSLRRGRMISQRRQRRRGDDGFTLVEVLVVFFVLVAMLVGMLTLFDQNTKLARTQTYVAGMQQSVRTGQYEMIRTVRMAGRGGLGRGVLPQGSAIAVRNNVTDSGDEQYIAIGDGDSPKVLPGTDVLTIRAAINSPILQVNPIGGGYVLDNPDAPTSGTIRLRDPHPTTGLAQDLQPVIDAVEDDDHAALLLVSPLDAWALVEVDRSTSDVTTDPADITIAFTIGSVAGTGVADQYIQLTGGFPNVLRSVSHVAILEEYRYYIREEYAISGDDTSQVTPRLARARFYPNTEIVHPSDAGFTTDIADNIFDLQIALGIDTDATGVVEEGGVEGIALTKKDDDWLFNDPTDTDNDGAPAEPLKWNPLGGLPDLSYVRITNVARTDRPELGYQAPLLDTIEDNDYSEDPQSLFNSMAERHFRRRALETTVDMRNL